MTPAEVIEYRAKLLVDFAAREGLVLTVEQQPLQPPAMGHYRTTVSVRPARVRAEPRRFDLDNLCREALQRIDRHIDALADDAIVDLGISGVLARKAMEERHHGPSGAGGAGMPYFPPGSINIVIGGNSAGGPFGSFGGRP